MYARSETALEAGSNYFTIYDTLDEYLAVTLANPGKAEWLKNQQQKDDRKDAKNLARYLRLGEVPESYVLPDAYWKYRALARGRKKLSISDLISRTKSMRCWIRTGSRTASRCGTSVRISTTRFSDRLKTECLWALPGYTRVYAGGWRQYQPMRQRP